MTEENKEVVEEVQKEEVSLAQPHYMIADKLVNRLITIINVNNRYAGSIQTATDNWQTVGDELTKECQVFLDAKRPSKFRRIWNIITNKERDYAKETAGVVQQCIDMLVIGTKALTNVQHNIYNPDAVGSTTKGKDMYSKLVDLLQDMQKVSMEPTEVEVVYTQHGMMPKTTNDVHGEKI